MSRVHIDIPNPVLFTADIPVRITDLNYGNHLAHDRLVSILHEARVQFLASHQLEEANCEGTGIILVDLAVRYKAQVFYGQGLRVEISAGEPAARSCDLFYRVRDRDQGHHIAEAKTGLLFFDYERQRVTATPEAFRRAVTAPSSGGTP